MANQVINIGAAPDDGSGDPLRTAFDKVNDNFSELYGLVRAQGAVPVVAGVQIISFSTALASADFSLIIFDINGIGININGQFPTGFAIEALGAGVINYIAILNI